MTVSITLSRFGPYHLELSKLSRLTIGGTMSTDRDELLRLAASVEWLRPHDAGVILGAHRATINNMMRDGRLRWTRPGGKKLRVVSSEDVLRLLAEGGPPRATPRRTAPDTDPPPE